MRLLSFIKLIFFGIVIILFTGCSPKNEIIKVPICPKVVFLKPLDYKAIEEAAKETKLKVEIENGIVKVPLKELKKALKECRRNKNYNLQLMKYVKYYEVHLRKIKNPCSKKSR